ncbi:MAG: MFS transporter [Arenicellales bacterium]
MKPLLIYFPLGHMANDWAPGSIWLLAPAIAASMGLSPSEIGLLLAVHYMGAALGYLPAGILSDRISHQGRLLAATFWWVAVGYFCASVAPGFWSLAILLAIAGMGDAAWHPIATGVLVEQMPKRRGMVLGIHAMGGTLSEVGAPLSVGFLLAVFDWRTTLQISVIPAVIMGIVFVFFARHIPASDAKAVSRVELSQITRSWLKPGGLLLIGMISIYNMALMALMSMAPLYLQTDLSYSPAASGIVFATSMLLGSIMQPVIGRYSDSVDRHLVFIVGSILAIVCSTVAAMSTQPGLIVVAIVANMAILVGIRSSVLASAVEYASARAATTLGFVFVLLDGVGAIGAILAGYVGEIDLQYVLALAGFLSLISLLLSAILFTRRRSLPAGSY